MMRAKAPKAINDARLRKQFPYRVPGMHGGSQSLPDPATGGIALRTPFLERNNDEAASGRRTNAARARARSACPLSYLMAQIDALIDVLHPQNISGALFLLVVTMVAAIMLSHLLGSSINGLIKRRHERADVTGLSFLRQVGKVMIWLSAMTVYAHAVPALHKVGTALLTGVSIASVVIGLAAQSTLGNLIAGASLVLYRPFKIGDRLQVTTPNGVETGTVEAISLGHTTLQTLDNRRIVMANGTIATQVLVNLTSVDKKIMAQVPISVAYDTNVEAARAIALRLATEHPLALEVAGCPLTELAGSSVNMTLRVWCSDSGTAWQAKNELLEAIKAAYDEAGIEIPYAYQNVILKGGSAVSEHSPQAAAREQGDIG